MRILRPAAHVIAIDALHSPSAWLGFDILNPEAPEYDWAGTLARFDSGTLVGSNTPYLIAADC